MSEYAFFRDSMADPLNLDNEDAALIDNYMRLLRVEQFREVDRYTKRIFASGMSVILTQLSTAENLLHILRKDGSFTPMEARVLDLALVLHAEHGGGNNSSFTTHVVTSSGTDTYSAIAAALGSLKGPRHGGANIKVVQMFG